MALLSNPELDELYTIRRILVGRWTSSNKIGDAYGMNHYAPKINAMDKAIAAFIESEAVPKEHTEIIIPLASLHQAMGGE